MNMAKVTITVNGVKHTKSVEDRTLLVNFLRSEERRVGKECRL